MSTILNLPKVSDNFLKHIEGRALEKNEWTPCPRCGEGKVEPPSGALSGFIAGFGAMGCLFWIVGIGVLIMAVISWPFAVFFAIIGLALILLMPAMGAGWGLFYRCKSCGFNWTYKDIEKYKDSTLAPQLSYSSQTVELNYGAHKSVTYQQIKDTLVAAFNKHIKDSKEIGNEYRFQLKEITIENKNINVFLELHFKPYSKEWLIKDAYMWLWEAAVAEFGTAMI